MTCPQPPVSFRPVPYDCAVCGERVTPKNYREELLCAKCQRKRTADRRRLGLPLVSVEQAADLGPEHPELGMTTTQKVAWRERRIVELYLAEEELTVDGLAERFDTSSEYVHEVLREAGIQVAQGRGSGIRVFLPAGPPCP